MARCAGVVKYYDAIKGRVVIAKEMEITMSEDHHSGDDCPCKMEIISLKKKVEELTSKIENYDRMFAKINGSLQGFMTTQTAENAENAENGGWDIGTETTDDNIVITISNSAVENTTIKEEPNDLMEDDKGMLNCGKGNELLIYPSSGVANEFYSIQYPQSDPIEISDANSNQRQPCNVQQENGKDTGGVGKKVLPCPHCGKLLRSKDSLRVHVKRHTHPTPIVPCKFCGKGYKNMQTLARHIKNLHKPFKCHLCTSTFTDITSYNVHMQTHSEKVPIQRLFVPQINPQQVGKVDMGEHKVYLCFVE